LPENIAGVKAIYEGLSSWRLQVQSPQWAVANCAALPTANAGQYRGWMGDSRSADRLSFQYYWTEIKGAN